MSGSNLQERLNKQAVEYISGWRSTAAALWEKCCSYDEVGLAGKFVIFSDDNPYVVFYNNAMRQYLEARMEFAAGGYVGLRIGERKIGEKQRQIKLVRLKRVRGFQKKYKRLRSPNEI